MEQGAGELTSLSSNTEEDYVEGQAWCTKPEQPPEELSRAQPLSHSGSLYRSNFCHICSAVFMLPRSLQAHLKALHHHHPTVDVETGEVTIPSPSEHSSCPSQGRSDRKDNSTAASQPFSLKYSGPGRFSFEERDGGGGSSPGLAEGQCPAAEREDIMASSHHFTIKLEPAAPMEEEGAPKEASVLSGTAQTAPATRACGSRLPLTAPHICPRCFDSFVLFTSLELHLATFHGQSLQELFPLYSPYCWSSAGHQQGLRVAEARTTSITTASTTTSTSDSSKRTVKRKKEDNMEGKVKKPKKHACDVCGRAFVLAGDLKRHKMIHTGQKPFVCDVCSKAFARAVHLKEHQRVHTGEKPYICQDCGKRFSHATNLKNHQVTHTGEKPHICDICWACFSERNHLKQHKRTHTGEKPYVCRECGKGFALSFDLKRHHLMHTGEKPFTCPHCPVAFVQSRSLKRHLQKVHSEMLTESAQ